MNDICFSTRNKPMSVFV